MTRFKLQISCVGSEHSTNCAQTTHPLYFYRKTFELLLGGFSKPDKSNKSCCTTIKHNSVMVNFVFHQMKGGLPEKTLLLRLKVLEDFSISDRPRGSREQPLEAFHPPVRSKK